MQSSAQKVILLFQQLEESERIFQYEYHRDVPSMRLARMPTLFARAEASSMESMGDGWQITRL